jgi:hypothetical protein
MSLITRRVVIAGLAGAAVFGTAFAQSPFIRVSKDPNCGCCQGWVEHLRAAGFVPSVNESNDLTALKARLGIPSSLFSCHTAESEGYAVEGHVPAQAIRRLLLERPDAKGLAVPGMPIGSPGMEVPGRPDEEYAVVLFGAFGQRTFARFKGIEELPVRS